MSEDVTIRARKAFAAYRGLGREIVDELIAEIERLRALSPVERSLSGERGENQALVEAAAEAEAAFSP